MLADGPARDALPCSLCGEPAVGWRYVSHEEEGVPVVDAYAACREHLPERRD